MSDRAALILAVTVCGIVAADLILGLGGTLFVLRRLVGLVDWVAFWR